MINLKASRKAPTISVGVNPVTNVHVNSHNGETTQTRGSATITGAPVVYPNPCDPGLSYGQGIPNGLVLGAFSPFGGVAALALSALRF